MNQVVADLFHQAGGVVRIVNGYTWTYTDDFDPEKFAQLIINQCTLELNNVFRTDQRTWQCNCLQRNGGT